MFNSNNILIYIAVLAILQPTVAIPTPGSSYGNGGSVQPIEHKSSYGNGGVVKSEHFNHVPIQPIVHKPNYGNGGNVQPIGHKSSYGNGGVVKSEHFNHIPIQPIVHKPNYGNGGNVQPIGHKSSYGNGGVVKSEHFNHVPIQPIVHKSSYGNGGNVQPIKHKSSYGSGGVVKSEHFNTNNGYINKNAGYGNGNGGNGSNGNGNGGNGNNGNGNNGNNGNGRGNNGNNGRGSNGGTGVGDSNEERDCKKIKLLDLPLLGSSRVKAELELLNGCTLVNADVKADIIKDANGDPLVGADVVTKVGDKRSDSLVDVPVLNANVAKKPEDGTALVDVKTKVKAFDDEGHIAKVDPLIAEVGKDGQGGDILKVEANPITVGGKEGIAKVDNVEVSAVKKPNSDSSIISAKVNDISVADPNQDLVNVNGIDVNSFANDDGSKLIDVTGDVAVASDRSLADVNNLNAQVAENADGSALVRVDSDTHILPKDSSNGVITTDTRVQVAREANGKAPVDIPIIIH